MVFMQKTIEFLNSTIKEREIVVLGLSGGPDSMCLLHLLLKIKEKKNITIICAHVNHNLRKESAEEETFVKRICEQKA